MKEKHKIKTNNFVKNSRIGFNDKLPQFSSFLDNVYYSFIFDTVSKNSVFLNICLILVKLYSSPVKLPGLFGYEG